MKKILILVLILSIGCAKSIANRLLNPKCYYDSLPNKHPDKVEYNKLKAKNKDFQDGLYKDLENNKITQDQFDGYLQAQEDEVLNLYRRQLTTKNFNRNIDALPSSQYVSSQKESLVKWNEDLYSESDRQYRLFKDLNSDSLNPIKIKEVQDTRLTISAIKRARSFILKRCLENSYR